jgi:hypothetical protein
MKSLIIATALGLALFSAPAVAQDRGATTPGTGTGVDTGPGTGMGTGSSGTDRFRSDTDRFRDPGQRGLSETERSRSFDRQRGASPMTSDPRLGPPTGTGSGSSSGSLGGSSSGSSGGVGTGSGSSR